MTNSQCTVHGNCGDTYSNGVVSPMSVSPTAMSELEEQDSLNCKDSSDATITDEVSTPASLSEVFKQESPKNPFNLQQQPSSLCIKSDPASGGLPSDTPGNLTIQIPADDDNEMACGKESGEVKLSPFSPSAS